jgi:transcription elongation factor Elf1
MKLKNIKRAIILSETADNRYNLMKIKNGNVVGMVSKRIACPMCGHSIYVDSIKKGFHICLACGYYFEW